MKTKYPFPQLTTVDLWKLKIYCKKYGMELIYTPGYKAMVRSLRTENTVIYYIRKTDHLWLDSWYAGQIHLDDLSFDKLITLNNHKPKRALIYDALSYLFSGDKKQWKMNADKIFSNKENSLNTTNRKKIQKFEQYIDESESSIMTINSY